MYFGQRLGFPGVFLYITFKGDSPEEKKYKANDAKKLAQFENKYNYDVDSLAKTIKPFSYESSPDKIKGNFLILEEQNGKYLINVRNLTELPETIIAYDLKDLKTVIIQKFDKIKESGFGERLVERYQAELSFYDIESSLIYFKTTVVSYGEPYVVERGRNAGAKTYFLQNSDITKEILKIIKQ